MRRLNRAGEGEYRVNGAKCRLVDVIEILSDTGLGKEMHSVVSQGRVEAIVTSKPRKGSLGTVGVVASSSGWSQRSSAPWSSSSSP